MNEIIKRNCEAVGLPNKVDGINGLVIMNALPVRFFVNDLVGGWLINDGVIVGRDECAERIVI